MRPRTSARPMPFERREQPADTSSIHSDGKRERCLPPRDVHRVKKVVSCPLETRRTQLECDGARRRGQRPSRTGSQRAAPAARLRTGASPRPIRLEHRQPRVGNAHGDNPSPARGRGSGCLRDQAAVHPGAGSYQLWQMRNEPALDRRSCGSSSSCLGNPAAVRPGAGSPQFRRERDEPALDRRGRGSRSRCSRDRAAVRPGAGAPQLRQARDDPAPPRRRLL